MATRKNRKLVRRRCQHGVVAEVAAAYGVTVPAEAAVPALSPNQIGEIMGVIHHARLAAFSLAAPQQ